MLIVINSDSSSFCAVMNVDTLQLMTAARARFVIPQKVSSESQLLVDFLFLFLRAHAL